MPVLARCPQPPPAQHLGRSPDVIGCPDCGLVQLLPPPPGRGTLRCGRCGSALERTAGRSLDGALACSLATFALLFPANLLPLFRVDIIGHINQSIIGSGVAGFWRQHWTFAAVVVALEIVVFPFLRFGLLTAVLLAVKLGRQGRWLGPAFRLAEHLDAWAMADVFIFGCVVGYARVAPFLPIDIGAGGWCLLVVAFLTLVTRASLERRDIWRRIGPVVTELQPDMMACAACNYPLGPGPEGRRCPRCQARVWRCRPYATMRALALAGAAFVFYPAAYLYPMQYSDQLGVYTGYSIMTGVRELMKAGLWFFGAAIFFASVLVPLLKLFAFAWFGISIHQRSGGRLRARTRLHRLVDSVGRWSHVDVFTVAVFLPLMQLQGFLGTSVGRALPAFLAVVVLTMLASAAFDPRALWIAAESRP